MILVKEEFLPGSKIQTAISEGGWEVLGVWLALKGYAASHPTDGFVPDGQLDRLPGAPRHMRRLVEHLVNCGDVGPDGVRGAGLVDKVDHGWQLHDYLDHAQNADDLSERKERDRRRKRAERAMRKLAKACGTSFADVRRVFPGVVEPEELEGALDAVESGGYSLDDIADARRNRPRTVDGRAADVPVDESADSPERTSRAHVHAPARTHTQAQPNPTQPSEDSLGEPQRPPARSREDFRRFEASFQDRLPESWQAGAEHERLAKAKGLDVVEETAKFRAWCKANDRISAAWDSEFELWLRRANRLRGPATTETRAERETRELLERSQKLEAEGR
jgi:hypothetical protein